MATPHVAGAAALVRQAHPDWTAQQVKAALTASVKGSPEGTVYDQGSGELWTPDAIDAKVTSDVSVEVASFDWPHGRDERASETVTYTNDSGRDRAPAPRPRGRHRRRRRPGARSHPRAGRPLRHACRRTGRATVEVDARGDVGDLRDTAYGEIGGRIVASAGHGHDRLRVTTAVGMYLEPEMVDVTVRAIDRNGDPATSGNLDITDLHQPSRALHLFTGEDITLRLRAGSHFLSSFIRTTKDDGSYAYAHLVDPDRRFTHDTTLVLDARDTRRVSVSGDRPMKIRSGSFGVQRTWDRWIVGDSLFAERDPEFYATPTDRADIGDMTYGTYLRAFDPTVPTEESEYVYNLAFTEEDRVPSDLSYRVSDKRLARVDESWYAQRQPWEPEEWTRVVVDDGTGPFYSSSGDRVAAPGSRTAYYSPGVAWQQHASSGGFRTRPETWFDRVRTYRAGDRRETEWFKLPTLTAMAANRDGSPARIAERQGSLVGFAFPTWQDTVEGRYAAGGFRDIGGLTLWQDGEYVGHNPFPSGQADDRGGHLRAHGGGHPGTNLAARLLGDRPGTISRFTFRTSRPKGETHRRRCPSHCPGTTPRSTSATWPRPGRTSRSASRSTARTATTRVDSGRSRRRCSFDEIDPVGGEAARGLRLDRGPGRAAWRSLGGDRGQLVGRRREGLAVDHGRGLPRHQDRAVHGEPVRRAVGRLSRWFRGSLAAAPLPPPRHGGRGARPPGLSLETTQSGGWPAPPGGPTAWSAALPRWPGPARARRRPCGWPCRSCPGDPRGPPMPR